MAKEVKILVITDSHGAYKNLEQMALVAGDCQYVIHLGDYTGDVVYLNDGPWRGVISVKGNNDVMSLKPLMYIDEFEGVRLMAVHGHIEGVRGGHLRLKMKALENNVTLCLYGHTHVKDLSEDGGITFLNPGALYNGRYAKVTIKDGKFSIETLCL